ncbi:PP2C family protein-serine/threonine phosphatase [Halalkalibacter akibai]|nr:PP2C family protein-serine/threonine phosphatase [Halalkalibacter akibai]
MELQQDLQLAKNLQQMMLSNSITDHSISISGFYLPCQNLGGDFYKWEKVNENQYAIFIIDVMGHGISPSLLTMSLNAEIKSSINQGIINPVDVMCNLNNHMFDIIPEETNILRHYFTCIYLLVDTKLRKVDYINAGHPTFYQKDGNNIQAFESTTTPIGLLRFFDCEAHSFSYNKDCELLLYTDGLTDHLQRDLQPLMAGEQTLEQIKKFDYSQTNDDICVVSVLLKGI